MTLNCAVNGTNAAERKKPPSGSSAVESKVAVRDRRLAERRREQEVEAVALGPRSQNVAAARFALIASVTAPTSCAAVTDLPISASAQVRISTSSVGHRSADLLAPVVEQVGAVGGPDRAELHDQLLVVEPRGRRDLHRVAERLEQLRRALGGGDAVGVHRRVADRVRGLQADPEPAGVGADLVAVGARRRGVPASRRRGTGR